MKSSLKIENIKTPKQLGIALKRLRKKANLSQMELSKMMNMRQPTISDIESGRGTLESFFKIIQALKINISLANNTNIDKKTKSSKINNMLDLLKD